MEKEKKILKNVNINNINSEEQLNKNNKNLAIEEKIEEFVNSIGELKEDEIFKFRKANSENILFDKTKYPRNNKPEISVILTVKNQAHCIHKALRSIQNQSLKNIEIIISVDCSRDNSTETISSYMKEDERITMISHDTNEGTMKIRIDGIRKAKGKFITIIDGDDSFINKDILKNALHIATLGNIDIVEFQGNMYIEGKLKGFFHYHKIDRIIRQPELRTKFISNRRLIVCRSIVGKIIKNEVFQKIIETIGPKYTEDYITIFEDTIMVVASYQIAQSYYLFKQPGYYYSRDEKYKRNPEIPNKKCIEKQNVIRGVDSLKYINFLYDKMEDNEIERQTLCNEIISIQSYFPKFSLKVNHHYDMLFRVLDKLVDNKYLTEKEKERIKTIKNKMISKKKE